LAQAPSPTPEQLAIPAVGSMSLEEMEKTMILQALSHYDGNLAQVAEALGLSRYALYRRLEKFGLKTD
jgi:DNA-binding NtrC family response regulator